PSPLFNTPSRPSLLHKLIISHLASLRTGNASTKNRSQVNYSGKKLRPQKGTGGARLGSRGSPMLRGGGNAFALTPKGPDGWMRKVNRKEEQLGLRVGISDKWRSGDLVVVDKVGLEEIGTRVLRERLATRGWTDALFILNAGGDLEAKDAFVRSAGNLPGISVVEDPSELGIWEIVKSRKVVIELDALEDLIKKCDPEGKLVAEEEWDFEGEEEEFLTEEQEAEFAGELEEALKGEEVRA
ncbi:large subunit ribosomal protein L4, partial [Phenoliferia sp. Uapishka_3]